MQANVVTDVGMVLGVAAVTSVVARVARQPTIVGYLLAGLLVGPYLAFPLFADHHRIEALAEFGVVLVMFAVGLELRLGRFIKSLPATGLTGLVQVGTMVYVGFALGSAFGWTPVSSLFLGTAIAISSTMVVTRVFAERRPPGDVADHVISVLVLQDVVAIVLIAAMTGVARGGGMAPGDLALLLVRLAGVLVAMAVGGLLVVPPLLRVVARISSAEMLTVFSVGLCFGYAVLAQELGYSVALGAFIAGVVVAESGRGPEVEHVVAPLRDVFAAIFFVSIGMTVDPTAVWTHLPASLAVAGAVILAQLLSVGTAGVLTGLGPRRAIIAGLALGQVGEFGFILAGIGAASGVVDGALQPILVTVAVLTSLTTPLTLRHSEAFVGLVNRLTPARLLHLLSLYESWLERLRDAKPGARSPLRRAFVFLTVDVLVIVAVLGVAIAWAPELTTLIADAVDLSRTTSRLLLAGAVILLSLPLLFGVVRNATLISKTIGDIIVSSATSDEEATTTRIALHGLRALIYLAIVVGVGLPAVAALRPLMDGYYAIPILAGVVVVLSVVVWRRAGRVDEVYQSGVRELVERIAQRARTAGAPETEALEVDGHDAPRAVLPGIDGSAEVVVGPDSTLLGKSLRELGLRVATGATVLAIDHHGGGATAATGDERLEVGDVCIIAGSAAAVAAARRALGEQEPSASEG